MLAPNALSVSQLPVAQKVAAGYEEQLYASTLAHSNPGVLQISGLNSGVYNPSVAGSTQLAAAPQELVAQLGSEVNTSTPIVVTVVGADQNGNAFTGVATFAPPSYVQFQENVFPRNWAVDVIPGVVGQQCKTITGVSATCGADVAPLAINIIGIPSFASASGVPIPQAQAGSWRLISAKMKLDFTIGAPEPHAVQIGRDKAAQIKPGEIPEKNITISAKASTFGDGLIRINGQRVTGLVREVKEDKVETMRTYLLGMIITSEPSAGQSVEDVELAGKGLCEQVVLMVAR